ncbi:TPA: ATP-dependent helicase [Pseudomonas aeruginosa]|uniref:UvrD-helicase domain-containing protein n=1 Tax=Pseudomonas aeruginosa TaxID=287 RepID=UPI00115A78EE|nr:ATP-dependent helicase [Pseudomonas aeruginosa]EKX5153425.1 ATP-dependent helicase [Pseudomonas aeruginosa]ELW3040562.1 ATP-dependent helicase [Pseudomonas aeruginosa]MBI7339040.1 ATP-dependent helicase [Pseudomonas aeruginosa]TQR59710.1 DNA helicase [Pseudomonas aeruginosa]HBP1888123.1 ATP-dependent helicase [Pseudomonas aeruginosa]
MLNFTPQQTAAIDHSGNLVVTACPGSGKTTVISEKIRNEISTLKKHQGVVAITFTRKASKELANRCKRGGLEIKASFFGTIDSFCLSEIIFPFAKSLFGASLNELEPKFPGDLNQLERDILAEVALEYGDYSSDTFDKYLPALRKLYDIGCIYFPAITQLALHIINSSAACRRYIQARYTTTYIDEYQDSSQLQHDLFLTLLGLGIRCVCVGDVQQSIYGFRDSKPELLEALINRPDFEHLPVSVNHRCHPSIANYANRLFEHDCELQTSEAIRVYQCKIDGDEYEAALKLNNIIAELTAKFPVSKMSEVAILTRHNRGLERLREKLTIPCKIYTEDVLSRIESRTSMLWTSLLEYRFSKTLLPDDLIDSFATGVNYKKDQLKNLRSLIRRVKSAPLDQLINFIPEVSTFIFGGKGTGLELNALKVVLDDPELILQYQPAEDDQVQCMTIHKSKGLEFEIVIHLDLVEWVMPKRVPGLDFNDRIYPEWEQDLNLHYVAITRAKAACVLVHTSRRTNSSGVVKQGARSEFLQFPSLENLYKVVNK